MPDRYKIIIAEDEEDIKERIRQVLEEKGNFRVVGTCEHGEDLVGLCKEEKPDLVLMGIDLVDDLEDVPVAKELFELYKIPVVYVTSPREKEYIKKRALESYGYIVKPFSEDQLLTTVYLALNKARLEKRLLQAQKLRALGIFAGGVAHDFNNILAAIMGYAELIGIKAADREDIKKYVELILQAADRGKELVEHLLIFSRQREVVKKHNFPFHIILKESIKFVRSTLPDTIVIAEDIIKENDLIYADPSEMHQLCMNLLNNAIFAVQEKGGGRIEVSLQRCRCPSSSAVPGGKRDCLKLTVKDFGIGMDEDTIERIFEPFFTTKQKGSGLGLSVVHGIVTEMGGEIRVRSKKGEYTVFEVFLPVSEGREVRCE